MATQQLADPTNFGNKPGDGPLRVGGQSISALPNTKGDRPDTLSPAALAQRRELALCRDLWGGNSTVKHKTTVYLPKAPGEEGANYHERLERSVFFNVFRQTVVGLAGLIFRKDPELSEDVPAPIVEHWENIDLIGTHGDVFLKDIEEDALTAGHAAILVEFPKVDEMLDRASEEKLRPYWVPIKKDQILSWRTDALRGVTVLTQVVIQFDSWIAQGEFGEKLHTQYHVITRDLVDGIIRWRRLEVSKQGIVIEVDQGIYANQTEIPLAEIPTSGRESLLVSAPPLVDVAYLNIAHYQMWSDYANSIHKTCVPVFVLTGVDVPRDDSGQATGGIVVGANTVITIQNPQGGADYVSHDGAALGTVKGALDDLKSDMGTIGLAMLSPQKRTAETAESKRIDKATTDSALSATARGLQDGVENALKFHANYMQLDTGGSVAINRDFEGILLEAPVMQAYASLVNAGFPARLVLQALQKGGRITEDEDLAALELEFETNRIAEQERQVEAAKQEIPPQFAQGDDDTDG